MLEFIRTGRLSADAEAASNILQEALADTVLSTESHPYSYKCKHPAKGLLNPDLCPKWVTELLKSNGALERVEKGIQAHLEDVALEGFCEKFGVLISHLWEESMYPWKQELRDGMELRNQLLASYELEDDHMIRAANISPPPVSPFGSLPAEASTAIRHTSMGHDDDEREQPSEHEDAQIDALTSSSILESPSSTSKLSISSVPAASSPPSPPPFSPLLADKTTSKRSRVWDSNEDMYVKYLMTLNIGPAARLEKFQTRFGSRRTAPALAGRERWMRRNQPAMRRIIKWSPEEQTHLKKLVQDGKSLKAISEEMETRFGNGRQVTAYRAFISHKGLDVSRMPQGSQPQWTEEQDEYLKSLRENGTPLGGIPRLFQERFGIDRTEKACKARCVLKRWVHREPGVWTQEQLESLWGWCRPGSSLSRSEIRNKYWSRFGSVRSARGINQMILKMKAVGGIPENGRTWDLWTAEEEQFLKDRSGPAQRGHVAAFHAKFGKDRSRFAIQAKFASLRGDTNKV